MHAMAVNSSHLHKFSKPFCPLTRLVKTDRNITALS